MVQYTRGMIPKDAPVSFAAMVRQQADVHARAPYIYPFAWPGNQIAAWREGIPLPRYDALSAEPLASSFVITFDRAADRFLLDGWGPAGANAAGPFRTVGADGATLVFPLAGQQHDVDVSVVTSARGDEHAAGVDVSLALNGVGIGRFRVSGPAAVEQHVRIPAGDVGRILRAGYNRLLIVTSGAARAAVHRVRIAPTA